ncbi:hypothetical protein NKJ08_33175, partial [Mesorhizobium sp. M0244]
MTLTAVTRYGTEAAIATDGTITGGTAKLLGQMIYQNTDGVYTTVNARLYEHTQFNIFFPPSYTNPKEVGDLDFDGRDEVFGDYTETAMSGQTIKTNVYKRIIKFGAGGIPADNKTVFLRIKSPSESPPPPDPDDPNSPNPPKPVFFSDPGRFLSTKNTMDFVYYTNGPGGSLLQPGYYSQGAFLLTDAQLGMAKSDCNPTAPTGYQSVCSALPYGTNLATRPDAPTFVADPDGDGVDNLNVNANGDLNKVIGVGDFLGSGRQQPLFAVGLLGGNVKKGILSNGTWVLADPSFSPIYEADGQTKEITYANGVKTSFIYSPNRRWLNRVTTAKGATVLLDDQYARDLIGRITGTTGLTAADSWTYGYDKADRLTSSDNLGNNTLDETFVYAANDNLTSRTRVAGTYVYPAASAARPHAPTAVGAKTLTYDANGNMTADGTRTLVWDEANRLKTVTQATTVSLFYGPDGARAKKASSFATTLYPDASVEIDPATPGAEIYTRYP